MCCFQDKTFLNYEFPVFFSKFLAFFFLLFLNGFLILLSKVNYYKFKFQNYYLKKSKIKH